MRRPRRGNPPLPWGPWFSEGPFATQWFAMAHATNETLVAGTALDVVRGQWVHFCIACGAITLGAGTATGVYIRGETVSGQPGGGGKPLVGLAIAVPGTSLVGRFRAPKTETLNLYWQNENTTIDTAGAGQLWTFPDGK